MFGGIVDVKAARKQTHFVELCDTFNIPLIFLVDVPGFQVGMEVRSRRRSCATACGPLSRTCSCTVPVYTVVVRKCYGMAGGGTIDRRGLNFKIAWPSAEWGSLPIEGGVKAAYRREIEAAADPAQREARSKRNCAAQTSPFRPPKHSASKTS